MQEATATATGATVAGDVHPIERHRPQRQPMERGGRRVAHHCSRSNLLDGCPDLQRVPGRRIEQLDVARSDVHARAHGDQLSVRPPPSQLVVREPGLEQPGPEHECGHLPVHDLQNRVPRLGATPQLRRLWTTPHWSARRVWSSQGPRALRGSGRASVWGGGRGENPLGLGRYPGGSFLRRPAQEYSPVATKASSAKIETIVALAKRRGFVFASGEIYGGTRSAWDYGPLGVELKENIKRQWWKTMVTGRDDVVGLDSLGDPPAPGLGRLGPPRRFTDPLIECQQLPQAASAPTSSPRSSPSARARRPPRTACPRCRAPTAARAGSTPSRATST